MNRKFSLIIFTDLDGSLLHRDTFQFDEIKNYLLNLISKGIHIIPNSSKTEKEILSFNKELGADLPYISENGSAIHGLDLLNINFPNKIILSREKKEIIDIFNTKVPENLKNKCEFISQMSKKKQMEIFGLPSDKFKNAIERKFSTPLLFKGDKISKNKMLKILKKNSLTFQEGGRVVNLCDNVNKVKSMNKIIKIFKKIEDNFKVVAVGDNYNDLEMLRNSDVPCLVFNDQFKQDQININNLIVSSNPSPQGWVDVIKMALDKLGYND